MLKVIDDFGFIHFCRVRGTTCAGGRNRCGKGGNWHRRLLRQPVFPPRCRGCASRREQAKPQQQSCQRSTCASDRGKAAGGFTDTYGRGVGGVDALNHRAAPWVDAPLGFFGCLQKAEVLGGELGLSSLLAGGVSINPSPPTHASEGWARLLLLLPSFDLKMSRGGVGIHAQRQQRKAPKPAQLGAHGGAEATGSGAPPKIGDQTCPRSLLSICAHSCVFPCV